MADSNLSSVLLMSRVANVLLGIMLICSIAVGSYGLFADPSNVDADEEKLVEEISVTLAENEEAIVAETQQVAAQIMPPIAKAIIEQTQADSGAYWRELEDQASILSEKVGDQALTLAKKRYKDFLRKHRSVLAKEFPENADEEALNQLFAEFETLGNKLIDRYHLAEFESQANRTAELWAKVEPVKTPEEGEEPLRDQLVEYAGDWSVLAFTDEAEQQVFSD